jgi:phosphopantetheine adenylyltransferase
VKQSAILFNLMPDYVKGAASKLAAKISIAKETANITQEVNMYRATKGVPPMRVSLPIPIPLTHSRKSLVWIPTHASVEKVLTYCL